MAEEEFEKRSDEKLGEYLVRIREARGLSREDLAKATSVSIKYLEYIESGDWKQFSVEAYLRSYVNSVATKLGLDAKQVLVYLSAEIGSNYSHEFDALEPERNFVNVEKNGKSGSKAKLVVIVIILIAILAALGVLLKMSEIEALTSRVMEPAEKVAVEDSAETVESVAVPEGAEAVAPDTTAAVDEDAVRRAVDSVAAAKDLPASATIFLSSDSKETAEPAAEKKKFGPTKIELIANGKDSSWVGIKRSASSDNYSKQGKLNQAGNRIAYTTKDTMFVLIGNPNAVGEFKINDAAAKLPANNSGRALRFRVIGGKVLGGF